MTNEQREAIEKLRERFEPDKFGGICALGYKNKYCFGKSDLQEIDTLLSLIKEQDEAIQNYQNIIANNTTKMLKDELLQEKNKEIEIYKKMIEVMADCIAFGGKVHFGEPEKVIIYFKKKAISAILQEKEDAND